MPEVDSAILFAQKANEKGIQGKKLLNFNRPIRYVEKKKKISLDAKIQDSNSNRNGKKIGDDNLIEASTANRPDLNSLITKNYTIVEEVTWHGKQVILQLSKPKNCGISGTAIIVFKLGLGAAFDWVNPNQLTEYPFEYGAKHSRLNIFFQFEGINEHWVLLDCTSSYNLAKWEIYLFDENINIMQALPIIWPESPYDSTIKTHFNAWIDSTRQEITQNGEELIKHSIAKILSDSKLFIGIGTYLRTEICARLWKYWKLSPWDTLYSLQERVSLPHCKHPIHFIVALYHGLLKSISRFYVLYDLSIHHSAAQALFFEHILLAYRKSNVHKFQFKANNSTKDRIWTEANNTDDGVIYLEKWKEVLRKKTDILHPETSLLVGPLSWHSKGSFSKLEVIEKEDDYDYEIIDDFEEIDIECNLFSLLPTNFPRNQLAKSILETIDLINGVEKRNE